MKSDCRPWLLDPERRAHLLGLYREDRKSDLPEDILNEMNAQGLVDIFPDGSQHLSRKGTSLAYNIAEFGIQVDNRSVFPIIEKLNVFPGSIVLDVGCG